MATKKVKPGRALVNPPAAKAKGVKQAKHPVMVLFQKRNRKGTLRWYQHILAANGKITSKLAEGDGYPSLSAVKRAVKQDEVNRGQIKSGQALFIISNPYTFTKTWWNERIEQGFVIIRKANNKK